ncbi:MAG TPA: GNAT family N-acetyltransferase [Niastella sp.]
MKSKKSMGINKENGSFEEQLIKYRPALLFKFNAVGDLLTINEPTEPYSYKPPILYACWAKSVFVFKMRADLPKSWQNKINNRLLQTDSFNTLEEIKVALIALTGELGVSVHLKSGPAFYIPREPVAASDVIEVHQGNREVLQPNDQYTYQHIDHLQPCNAKIINGKAVAICRTVRRYLSLVEAGVDTIEAYRNRGFGAQAVASWAAKAWSEGLIPCYSTASENKASLALASKMKMIQYATDISISLH